MKIIQLSIFLENKPGHLTHICSVLSDNAINIRALSLAESTDFGVLRLIVDKPQKARDILKQHNIVASLTDIVAVEIDDKPGGLAKVLDVLSRNGINVEYMTAFVERSNNLALAVMRFDSPDQAIKVLTGNGIKVVKSADIL